MSTFIRKILGNIATRIMLTIYLMIVLMTTFFVVFGYVNQLNLQEQRQYEKLSGIVSALAYSIDGDVYQEMMNTHPKKDDIKTNLEDKTYKRINKLLSNVKATNKLSSDIYTLTYDSKKDVFLYGITSSENPYFRHEYQQYPKGLLEKINEGGIIPLYDSENGSWLSAFHPIKNKKGETIGLVEADIEFTYFKDAVNAEYIEQSLISLVVIVLISLFLIAYTRKILRQDQKQKELFSVQKSIIEDKNNKITASINYAQRIQNAIIPQQNFIRTALGETATFYKPKDIVSGDFPYYYEKNGYKYYAAVDCTGHGVPGAMMSLIGHLILNDILNGDKLFEPGEVLNRLHAGVVKTLKQDDPENKTADGMDVALCRISPDHSEVLYAGAHRPLYHLQNGKIIQHKGDKFPVGGNQYGGKNNFTTHHVDVQKGDSLYFFSDGYPDQFGGPENLKFGPKRMRGIIEEKKEESVADVISYFEQQFEEWMGDEKQIDDVLLIGIQF
jgi:serine phosphatase RsbU (regulator of sigma subunit)